MARARRKLPHDPNEVRMSIGAHLDELRGCLVRSIIALVLACLISVYPCKWLLAALIQPFRIVAARHGQPTTLLATSPIEFFLMYVKVVLVAGLLLASPYIAHQIWSFVAAGLYGRERKAVTRLVWPSVGLFIGGALFMYFFVLVLSLNFFFAFSNFFSMPDSEATFIQELFLGDAPPASAPATQPIEHVPIVPFLSADPESMPPRSIWYDPTDAKLKIRTEDGTRSVEFKSEDSRSLITTHYKIGEYLSFVLVLMVAFGLAFQMPLVVVFLVRSGIVPEKTMRQYRKVIFLIIVVIAAMIAPPDLVSHLLLSAPMIGLFEIGLWIARRKTNSEDAPQDASPSAS